MFSFYFLKAKQRYGALNGRIKPYRLQTSSLFIAETTKKDSQNEQVSKK